MNGKIAPSAESLHDSLYSGVHIGVINDDVGDIGKSIGRTAAHF